jgi:hypothetical protein
MISGGGLFSVTALVWSLPGPGPVGEPHASRIVPICYVGSDSSTTLTVTVTGHGSDS